MQELMKVLTEMCKEIAEHHRRLNSGAVQLSLPLASVPAKDAVAEASGEEAPKRHRRTKAEMEAAKAPTATPAAPEEKKADLAKDALTEAESVLLAKEAAASVLTKFNKPAVNGAKDGRGNPVVEGFFMVKKILADEFKVAKMADLTHSQRQEFAAKCKVKIAEADKAPAASVATGTEL